MYPDARQANSTLGMQTNNGGSSGICSGVYVGGGASAQVVQAPQTLARAMESVMSLNARMGELSGRCHQLAAAIGGPYPAAGNIKGGATEAPSAMGKLNDDLDYAHSQLSDIEGAIAAMQRALGA
jgi:hypothetical protein